MARNVTIRQIDLGWAHARSVLLGINGAHVDVGIFAEAGQHPNANASVAQVGAWNEFGTDDVPERPFLRTTYTENQDKFARQAQRLLRGAVQGTRSLDDALQSMGGNQATAVKKTITDWAAPPNAPSTVAQKGQNDPLVDTRLMRDSIQFKKHGGRR